MAVEFNVTDDFGDVLDGLEPITLVRRGKAESVPVEKAWRYSSVETEAESTGGAVVQSDVDWQFPWSEAVDLPRIGDTIIDGSDQCWTILAVEQRSARTRVRCRARNLRIVYGLDDRVEIQVAVWGDLGSGPEIVGWQTIQNGLPARIQPDVLTVDNESDPATSLATFRIILGEHVVLDHNHRIVAADGAVYQILEYRQEDRLDALPIATAVRQDGSAS